MPKLVWRKKKIEVNDSSKWLFSFNLGSICSRRFRDRLILSISASQCLCCPGLIVKMLNVVARVSKELIKIKNNTLQWYVYLVVIMPPSALEQLTRLNIIYPMLFKLTNKKTNRITHCGVLEFIADEGKVYLPYWVSTRYKSHFKQIVIKLLCYLKINDILYHLFI